MDVYKIKSNRYAIFQMWAVICVKMLYHIGRIDMVFLR